MKIKDFAKKTDKEFYARTDDFMKDKIFLFGIAVFLCALAYIPIVKAETLPSVTISNIQISGVKADDEFVRLKNETDIAIDLAGFKLTKKSFSGETCKESALVSTKYFQGTIQPKGFFLISHPDYKNFYNADLDYSGASYYLSDNNIILLYNNEEKLLDKKIIGSACDTVAPNPDPPTTPDQTPVPTPTSTTPATIRINEIFPNPKAKGDVGEFVELYNFGTEPADISNWILRDATKTGKYVFPSNTLITASAYFVVTDQDFKLSLNNSNETISLFDKNEKLVDSAHYEKTKEDVSLNYTPSGWRGGTPTPGAENQINNLPETQEKVPKKGYRGTPIEFKAKGKDIDGDTLKYTWDFGDGHKSYKANTSHAYEKNGTYTVTLKTDDGQEEMLETFTIEIRSYVYPKIRITSFAPNPAGNDTDNEWLMLENRGKKTVNLKGFGIATGWKNLVNHPVREDFIIEPKQEAKLTREHSLFTLPNQKGKIELRAPDGKVLQKIKYKLEKSIAENAVYRKKKGERWNFEMPDAKNISGEEDVSEEENGTSLPAPTSDILAPDESQNDQDIEEEVLGASTAESDTELPRDQRKRDQQWMKLVSLGTRAAFPENIEFSPESEPVFAEQAPERSDASLMQETLLDLNASLNNMFNNSLE